MLQSVALLLIQICLWHFKLLLLSKRSEIRSWVFGTQVSMVDVLGGDWYHWLGYLRTALHYHWWWNHHVTLESLYPIRSQSNWCNLSSIAFWNTGCRYYVGHHLGSCTKQILVFSLLRDGKMWSIWRMNDLTLLKIIGWFLNEIFELTLTMFTIFLSNCSFACSIFMFLHFCCLVFK